MPKDINAKLLEPFFFHLISKNIFVDFEKNRSAQQLLKQLLNKVSLSCVNEEKLTPCDVVCKNGNYKILKFLLEYARDKNELKTVLIDPISKA